MIRDLLARLRDATPPPPDTGDVDEMLDAFAAVVVRRQAILDEIRTPFTLTDAEREIAREVVARQDRWRDALAAAHAQVSAQRLGVGRLRRYAAAEGADLDR
jgi:hypothetical protein